jgi:hypothetical protein
MVASPHSRLIARVNPTIWWISSQGLCIVGTGLAPVLGSGVVS